MNSHSSPHWSAEHGASFALSCASRLMGLCLCLLLIVSAVSAQDTNASAALKRVSKSDEATAMQFAEDHHPELATLLVQLKEMDKSRYFSAIIDLNRTVQRLNRSQERVPERYRTELELWKIDSRVRLLAARSAHGMEDSIRDQIRQLLLQRNEIRLQQLKSDRDKLTARLDKMNETVDDLEANSQQIAERDLTRLVKSVKSKVSTNKTSPKKTTPNKTSK